MTWKDDNYDLRQANTDFVKLFKEATGATISVIAESSVKQFNDDINVIVLGGTNVAELAGITIDSSVEKNGYQLLTKGKSIFVLANTVKGVLNGTYGLLSELYNYEYYANGIFPTKLASTGLYEVYSIDYIDGLEFPELNKVVNPAFETILTGYGPAYRTDNDSATYGTRESANKLLSSMNVYDMFMEDSSAVSGFKFPKTHNVAELMNYAENKGSTASTTDGSYNLKKTGWFSIYTGGSASQSTLLKITDNSNSYLGSYAQLCYSGGNSYGSADQSTFNEMVAYAADRLAKVINADTTGNKYVQIAAEDNAYYCQCSACRSWYNHYDDGNLYIYSNSGSDNGAIYRGFMGLQLRFVNAVAKYVTNNNLLNANKRDTVFVTLAYDNYFDAPCKFVDGEYQPIDNDVVCPDNVAIYACPIGMDFSTGFADAHNQKFYNIFKALKSCTNHLGAWLYQDYYRNYFLTYNSFYGYADIYSELEKLGVEWIFNQGKEKYTAGTGFSNLKAYLNYKLAWDTSLDTDTLINNFFNAYFGDGAEDMFIYFNGYVEAMNDFSAKTVNKADATSLHNNPPFTQDEVEGWYQACETALSKVTDTNIQKRIQLEMISLKYMLIDMFGEYSFYTDCASLDDAKIKFQLEANNLSIKEFNNDSTYTWAGWSTSQLSAVHAFWDAM